MKVVGGYGDKAAPPVRRPKYHGLDEVVEEPIEWLYEGRFALGKVTFIVAKPESGKSTFLRYLAACVTTGRPFVEGPQVWRPPASVVLIQAEENETDEYLKPFRVLGGDVRKVKSLDGVTIGDDELEDPFSLTRDIGMLEVMCDEIGDVKLVVIDPMGEYVWGINGYNEAETRQSLQPLFNFARARKIAVVVSAHMTKSDDRDIMDRVNGSSCIVAKSRCTWFMSEDPADDKRRILSCLKTNIPGVVRTGLSFSFDENREGGVSFSPEPVLMRARQIDHLLQRKWGDAKASAGPPAAVAASSRGPKGFILDALAAGPVTSGELFRRATVALLPDASFRRTLKRLEKEGLVVRTKADRPALDALALAATLPLDG